MQDWYLCLHVKPIKTRVKLLYLILNNIINSILAVIYLNKLQNLINRLVMNCSMNIFVYFYFSNDIIFDFPSSGLIFL